MKTHWPLVTIETPIHVLGRPRLGRFAPDYEGISSTGGRNSIIHAAMTRGICSECRSHPENGHARPARGLEIAGRLSFPLLEVAPREGEQASSIEDRESRRASRRCNGRAIGPYGNLIVRPRLKRDRSAEGRVRERRRLPESRQGRRKADLRQRAGRILRRLVAQSSGARRSKAAAPSPDVADDEQPVRLAAAADESSRVGRGRDKGADRNPPHAAAIAVRQLGQRRRRARPGAMMRSRKAAPPRLAPSPAPLAPRAR